MPLVWLYNLTTVNTGKTRVCNITNWWVAIPQRKSTKAARQTQELPQKCHKSKYYTVTGYTQCKHYML